MKILILEPFFTGSHKDWAEGFKLHSKHEVQILSLPGRFWKWRMHGGAITLAKKYTKLNFKPDIILATDMLNLPVFKSLIKSNVKIVLYFHENQITYPWSDNDPDIKLKRDQHYGFINYTSALTADEIIFNSKFHLNSFFHGLRIFLNQYPDYNEMHNIDKIQLKSSVLHLGLNLKKFDDFNKIDEKSKQPLILWNHRWEYDKNPELFFKVLKIISNKNIDFKLIIIGQDFKKQNPTFNNAKNDLKKHIIQFGHVESFSEYAKWLWKAHIVPITSNQENFGISVMEAIYCNTTPLLPEKLSYPELFNNEKNYNFFYDTTDQLICKLEKLIIEFNHEKDNDLREIATKYDWRKMVIKYDKKFESLMNTKM